MHNCPSVSLFYDILIGSIEFLKQFPTFGKTGCHISRNALWSTVISRMQVTHFSSELISVFAYSVKWPTFANHPIQWALH